MQQSSGQMAAPDSRQHKPPMDLVHQKQRPLSISSSKDPPPKYMDPKMATSKKIPTLNSGNIKYPDQPKQSVPSQPQHSYQSHLASKSSNYQQQPPNYNQSMSNRSALPQSSDLHNLSVHHHQQHQPTQNNLYNLSSESSYNSRQQPPDDLLHNPNVMDGVDNKAGLHSMSMGKVPSLFSPDWSDKSSSKSEYKPALQPLSSPKMHERRANDTTPKKDKKRESPMSSVTSQKYSSSSQYPVADVKRSNSNSSSSSSSTATASNKRSSDFNASLTAGGPSQMTHDKSMYKTKPTKADDGDDNSKSMMNVKRPHSDASMFSYEDPMGEYNRDSKFMKLDVDAKQQQQQNLPFGSFSSTGSMLKTNTFNGIETNPDLVSSLLKESLGESKYSTIKMESMPHQMLQPPASLLQNASMPEVAHDSFKTTHLNQINTKPQAHSLPPQYQNPMMQPQLTQQQQQQQQQNHQSMEPTATIDPSPTVATLPINESDTDHKSKTEKKKKKDKNKHKEKDKNKDREERKKHKKDKERNRDKEPRDDAAVHNPIKIKIPKEKLNMSSNSDGSVQPQPTSGFKITIPKDRLTTSAIDSLAPPSGASLKIKISKDGGGGTAVYDVTGGQHHHHSKKRERDRGDRNDSKGHQDTGAMHRSGGSGPGAGNSSNSNKVR